MEKEQLILKIYNDLEFDIINGLYPIDSRLPSERELSIKYDATRIVIREAIAMLTKAGLVETRPQRGTFIKDFYNDVSLDSLINIAKSLNKIEIRNLQALLRFFSLNEIEPSSVTNEKNISENLKKIEAAILKKKLYDNPQILAECDYEIFYETAKVCLDPISIAITVSLKTLCIIALKMIYILLENQDDINQYDIKIFKALNSNSYDKASAAVKEKIGFLDKVLGKIEKIENHKIYLKSIDGKKGKIIDLEKYN